MFKRKCRVCAEKDARLADVVAKYVMLLGEKDGRLSDLKREMEYLRKLAFPAKQTSALPIVHLERDKLLNGDSDIATYKSSDGVLIDAETPDFPNPELEATALLTGNF